MLPFAVSIAALSLVQGALVALPAGRPLRGLERLRGRTWALIPPASIAGVILALAVMPGTAHALTVLALVAVPPLAAVALGWLIRGARPALAVLAVPLFLLAWQMPHSLLGEAATVALCGLSGVTLGTLLVAVAPAPALKVGIVLMALTDAALVISNLLQKPNSTLNAAAPGGGLPQLQHVVFGSAEMGYGDLFIAATFGALLASSVSRQRQGALLSVGIALAFDLLFFVVSELPATVPVALALVALELHSREPSPRRPVPAAGGLRMGGAGSWVDHGRPDAG